MDNVRTCPLKVGDSVTVDILRGMFLGTIEKCLPDNKYDVRLHSGTLIQNCIRKRIRLQDK